MAELTIKGNWPTWEWQVTASKAFFGGIKQDIRNFVWCISRQLGKTTLLKAIITRCMQDTPGVYWYLAPAYDRAETVYHETCTTLWELIQSGHAKNRKTSAGWVIRLSRQLGGSELHFKSLGNPEHLRGATLRGAVIDEVGLVEGRVIRTIIEPMLVALDGWTIYSGTPPLEDTAPDPAFFASLWEWAESDPAWWRIHRDYRAHPVQRVVDEIEKKRDRIPTDEFECEYLALFPKDTSYRLPALQTFNSIEEIPDDAVYYTTIDLADAENELHDPAAVVTYAVANQGHIYVVDARYHDNPSEVLSACVDQMNLYQTAAVKVQRTAFDKGFRYTLETFSANSGIYIPVVMVDIGGGSKMRRIIQMEPLARRKVLHVLSSLLEFQREWEEFPDNIRAVGGRRHRLPHHYDMLDACSVCVQDAIAFEAHVKVPPRPRNTVADYLKALKAKKSGVERFDRLYVP